MRVRDVMTRRVEMVHPDTPLQEAAEKMRELDVGPLLVCDQNRLVGVITDRDISVRSTAASHDPWRDCVRDAMTAGVYYCFEDQDTQGVLQLMKQKGVRCLAVLTSAKRVVGMVLLDDLAEPRENQDKDGKVGEAISQPGRFAG